MENCNIFYSWQSDIKGSKNFISDCLKQLPKKLKDMVVAEVDRDTEGIAGSPDIGDAIYSKIDKADIFVADVTIINKDWEGRKTPNPNVMIELGYAIKALGWNRIVLLYNKDYGNVESLPFDINHQRMTGYSLQEGQKAEVRNRIISNISSTISILQDSNLLHGGNPDVVSARQDLGKILLEGMKRIYCYFHKKCFTDWDDLEEDFVVVTDTHFLLAETLKGCLTDAQYFQLVRLLHKMKLTTIGDADHYGWEFAEKIAAEYFEPIYCEFGEHMVPLLAEQVFCEDFIMLYNAVVGKEDILYSPVRSTNGKTVFIDDGNWQEAYDIYGKLLCKGSRENGLFTGYRYTRDYDGDFVNSKRDGKGEEKTDVMCRNRFGCGTVRRKGFWKDNEFVEGTIYSAIVYKEDNGDFSIVDNGEKGILTADQQSVSFLISGCSLEKLAHYYVVDLECKDGEYKTLDNTLKSLKDADLYGCYEAFGNEELDE